MIGFYGVVDNGNGLGVVLEHMDGDLEDYMGELNVRDVLKILKGICWGLEYLHGEGFYHGDIKPGNVLMRRVGEGWEVKLGDFGNCKWVGGGDGSWKGMGMGVVDVESVSSGSFGEEDEGLVRRGSGGVKGVRVGNEKELGTLFYLAPDRWRKFDDCEKPHYAFAADVYAVAMVAYQCMERKVRLWNDLTDPWAVYREVVVNGGRPKWEGGRKRPKGFKEVVEKCWAEDPAERLTAAQLGIALQEIENSLDKDDDIDVEENDKELQQGQVVGLDDDAGGEENVTKSNEPATNTEQGEENDVSDKESHVILGTYEKGDVSSNEDEIMPENDAIVEPLPEEDEVDAENGETQSEGEKSGSDSDIVEPVTARNVIAAEEEINQEEGQQEQDGVEQEEDTVEQEEDQMNQEEEEIQPAQPTQPTLAQTRDYAVARRAYSMSRQRSSIDYVGVPAEGSVIDGDEHADTRPMRTDLVPQVSSTLTDPSAVEDAIEPLASQIVQSYEFQDLVEARDYDSLLLRATDGAGSVQTTVNLVTALELLLDMDDYEEHMIRLAGTYTLVSLLSRHGRHSPQLCSTICRCYVRLARRSSEKLERELRSNPVVNGALDTITWHPTDVPAMLAASMAIAALASASQPLCNQIVALSGRTKLHRALSRALSTFNYDMPLTLAALDGIDAIAGMMPEAVSDDGSPQQVLHVCRCFFMEREDSEVTEVSNKCLRILAKIASTPAGVKSILDAGGLPIVTATMDRESKSIDTLRSGCDVIRKIAREENEKVAGRFADANVVKVLRIAVQRGGEAQDFTAGCRLAGGAMHVLRHVCEICENLCSEIESSDTIQIVAETIIARQEHAEVVKEGAMLTKDILIRKRPANDAEMADKYMEVERMLGVVQATWIRNTDVSLAIKEALDAVRGIKRESPAKRTTLQAKLKNRFRRRQQ